VGFLVALQFLTVVPALTRREPRPAELGRSMAYYSLVGLLLGAILACLDWGLNQVLPPPLVAALIVASWTLATGGLHLDGLMDVCDGVFSQPTPERRLAVMKDTRAGSYGVLGAVCLLLVKYAAILSLPAGARVAALLLAPCLSRWSMTLVTAAFPSARPNGMGALVKASVGWPQVLVAGALALAAGYGLGYLPGAGLLVLAGVLATLLGWYFWANLGGLTGDTYGAINELVEVAVLIAVIPLPAVWRVW
jgi:adenosylcobinamide-GDP ribazoletransferase